MDSILCFSRSILQRVKNLSMIQWLFYTMILGCLAFVLCNIVCACYIACFFESANLTDQSIQNYEEVIYYVPQLGNISGILVIFVQVLLIILYPIARITKKFKFPYPKLYFFVPLVLLLIEIYVIIYDTFFQ